jgi:ABC-type polysaccharide/polyol phosphate export permease
MFLFSGAVFPLANLPKAMQWIAEAIPLTHVVRLARAFCIPEGLKWDLLNDLLYCTVFILITGFLALNGLKKRMID